MIKAAGVLFLTAANTALFLKRGDGSDHAGEWCFPGGQLEGDETPIQGAIRETLEESGRKVAESGLALLARNVSNAEIAADMPGAGSGLAPGEAFVVPGVQVDFTTFIARISDEFTPTLSDENTGYAWADISTPPEPLHPGCRIALARLGMHELDIARAIAAGDLTSPQKYENVWLFAIRITGTGKAFRTSVNRPYGEHVWRDASLYLNEEFLARCNGLPVIMQHPDKATLNTKEFAERVIGTITVPYIRGDEVWGIAKIYDREAAEMMSKRNVNGETLSTSPAVVFRDPSVNSKYRREDGSTVLIEGKPSLLDHIAVCSQGVWDKGGPPAGISVHDETGATKTMSEESEKAAREDAARRDAEETARDAKIDACVGAIADMGKRFDAMMDAIKDSMKRRDEGEVLVDKRRDGETEEECADRVKRKDGESREDWGKRMDAMRKDTERMDAAKADKARKDAEEAEKEKADAARRDAEEKERKEREEREDAARRDSVETAQRLAQLERVVATRPADEKRALAEAQARADRAYIAFADQAPPAMAGETHVDYRRRLARGQQKHSSRWAKFDLDKMSEDELSVAEGEIYADAIQASTDPAVIGVGKLQPFVEEAHGHTKITYHGSTRGWMDPIKKPASDILHQFA